MVKQNDKLNYTAQGYANAETVGVVEDTTVFVPQMIVGEEAIVKVNYAKFQNIDNPGGKGKINLLYKIKCSRWKIRTS